MQLYQWMPTFAEFVDGLTYVDRQKIDARMCDDGSVTQAEWARVEPLRLRSLTADMSEFTGDHWEIPFAAIALYLLMIVLGPIIMSTRCARLGETARPHRAARPRLRAPRDARGAPARGARPPARRKPLPVGSLVCVWNWFLSVFSTFGVVATWRCISLRLMDRGFEGTVCGSSLFMSQGLEGAAMMLFIYSKLFELLDTFFLIAKKVDVIFLHWYHHVTVLLYCWHSYAARIPSGIWFAAMNYFVHAVMYGYFAMTQVRAVARRAARRAPERRRDACASTGRARTDETRPPHC